MPDRKYEIKRKLKEISKNGMVSIEDVMRILDKYVIWRKRRKAKPVQLTPEEKRKLDAWSKSTAYFPTRTEENLRVRKRRWR